MIKNLRSPSLWSLLPRQFRMMIADTNVNALVEARAR